MNAVFYTYILVPKRMKKLSDGLAMQSIILEVFMTGKINERKNTQAIEVTNEMYHTFMKEQAHSQVFRAGWKI